MTVIEKWREIVDNGEVFNLLADMPKARTNPFRVFFIKMCWKIHAEDLCWGLFQLSGRSKEIRHRCLAETPLDASEAVARRCSVKKVLLNISQNLQENTDWDLQYY